MTRTLSLTLLLAVVGCECTGYVSYWNEYWHPNAAYPEARPEEYHPKYPYYPRDHHDYPPPYPQQPTRGEDAYPGRFLGMGTVNSHFGGRQVELICSLNEGDGKIVSNVVWTKVKGPYSFVGNPMPLPFDCPKCTYYPIDYDDHRIKAYDYHGKSILFIHEVHPEDYGIYRCTATAQVSYRGDIETVYQIVKL